MNSTSATTMPGLNLKIRSECFTSSYSRQMRIHSVITVMKITAVKYCQQHCWLTASVFTATEKCLFIKDLPLPINPSAKSIANFFLPGRCFISTDDTIFHTLLNKRHKTQRQRFNQISGSKPSFLQVAARFSSCSSI